jgi:protein TonB
MDFDAWTTRPADRDHGRRLILGYAVGIALLGSIGTAMAFSTPELAPEEPEEEVLEAEFAEEPEPEPEPEPVAPEPPPEQPQPVAPQPVLPELVTPVEVPDDAPEEKEPTADTGDAGGDPYASGAARGTVVARAVAPAPAPVVAPKSSAPVGPARMTAATEPPRVLSAPPDVYPAAAKAASIDGVVTVRFVVGVDGVPTQVKALRGPAELQSACEDSVKGTRYSPATDKLSGRPISVFHLKKCHYRLKT